MKLTDIESVDEWTALEKEIHRRWGLNAAVFDAQGVRVTGYANWANELCPLIKGHPKGGRFICAVAHQNLAAQAQKSGRPVIEACDAGMLKLVVPIFVEEAFLGVAGGCGCLESAEEIDRFMIQKTVGIDAAKLGGLEDGIPRMGLSEAREIATCVRNEIQRMVAAHARQAVDF